jgi:hypothetical protein
MEPKHQSSSMHITLHQYPNAIFTLFLELIYHTPHVSIVDCKVTTRPTFHTAWLIVLWLAVLTLFAIGMRLTTEVQRWCETALLCEQCTTMTQGCMYSSLQKNHVQVASQNNGSMIGTASLFQRSHCLHR